MRGCVVVLLLLILPQQCHRFPRFFLLSAVIRGSILFYSKRVGSFPIALLMSSLSFPTPNPRTFWRRFELFQRARAHMWSGLKAAFARVGGKPPAGVPGVQEAAAYAAAAAAAADTSAAPSAAAAAADSAGAGGAIPS